MNISLPFIPACSALMQLYHELWLHRPQAHQQNIAKKGVQAIPLPLLIQGYHKEIVTLQSLQSLLAGRSSRQRLTDGCIHTVQDGDLEQEVLDRKRQTPQDFLLHVIENKTLTPSKVL